VVPICIDSGLLTDGLAKKVGSRWIQCEDVVTGTQSSANYRYANTTHTVGRIEGHKVALGCNRMKVGEDFVVRGGASNQRVRDKRQVTMQVIQTSPKANEKQ
jgi:hypothetical protein